MAIIDYSRSLNAANQSSLGNILQGAGQLQGLRFNEENMQRQRDADLAKQQQAENQAVISKEAQDVYSRGDVNEIAAFSVANPMHGKNILAARGIVGEEGKQRVSDRFANVLTSANPEATLQQEIAQGEANGLDMTQSKEILAQGLSPEGIKRTAGMALASVDGQRFKDIQSSIPEQRGITKFQQGTGKLSGYVFNPDTGQYSVNSEIKNKLEKVKAEGVLDAKTRQSINKDFTMLTQDTKLIRNTAQDLEKLSKIKSGPASIAMVFKFMKALDPTSVVREGEFLTAENSSGVPEKIRNTYNKVMNGEKLGDKQMKEFVNTAKELANSAIDSSTTEVDSFIATFEETLPEGFKKGLRGRIPKRFDVAASKTVNWADL